MTRIIQIHSSRTHFVQGEKDGIKFSVAHSKQGKKLFCEFLDKKKANKLMKEEIELNPDTKYRIVTNIHSIQVGRWAQKKS